MKTEDIWGNVRAERAVEPERLVLPSAISVVKDDEDLTICLASPFRANAIVRLLNEAMGTRRALATGQTVEPVALFAAGLQLHGKTPELRVAIETMLLERGRLRALVKRFAQVHVQDASELGELARDVLQRIL